MLQNIILKDLTIPSEMKRLRDYLRDIYDKFDVLYTETAPNGNITERRGKIAIYNSSGTITTWVNTDGATTWQQLNTVFGDFDGGNYSEFESDGTLVFNGDATVYDDLRFPAQSVKLDSTNPPTSTAYKGGSVLAFASNPSQKIYFNAQLPHGWKMGDLNFHVHIVLPTAGAGGGTENVKFNLTYSWAYIGYDFPAETTITATRDVQNDGAGKHILMNIGTLLESNAAGTQSEGVSSMLICSLTRDVSVASDYAQPVYLVEADFHYEIDTVGSRSITSK